jgi:transmembrane sensor
VRREQREAAEWAARMRGAPTEADRAAFETWHAKPGNAKAYAVAEDDHTISGGVSRQRIEAKARVDSKAPSVFRWAAATIAAVGIAVAFAWHFHQRDVPQVASGPMLPGQLRLADGTTVTLMDGAWAEPQFSETERRLRLHGGRARFDVAHDASRPFIVVAGRSETKALGTVFEIDVRSANPLVRLVTGSVEVRLGGTAKAIRLAPGERAEVSESGPRLLTVMASPVATTMLAADNLPLGAVLDAANKTAGKTIRLSDPALAAMPVTGRFDVADSGRLARKLAAALDLVAEDRGTEIILTKK